MFTTKLTNGRIVDGTGSAPYRGAVYFDGDRIAAVTADESLPALKTFDVGGHVIAPGFIDIHNHSDLSYRTLPALTSYLLAGVTCLSMGQCGSSCIPRASAGELPHDVATYAADIGKYGSSLNYTAFVGHGTIRNVVMGPDMRPSTPDELARMCALLEQLFEQGATGLSFGLLYSPGNFAQEEELVALAAVAAKYDRVVSVHLRNENRHLFESLDEMFRIAEKTGVRLEISHLKVMGKSQWGEAGRALEAIDAARARGIRVTADQYPYTASHTNLSACFPKWALDGGPQRFIERLRDDDEWRRVSEGGLPEMYERGGPENIVVSDVPEGTDASYLGKSLAQIAREMDLPVTEAVRKMFLAVGYRIQTFYHSLGEEDVLTILARPDVSVISDGFAFDSFDVAHFPPHGGWSIPHPRASSSAVRALRLIREKKLMPLEAAVRKLTGQPADAIGWSHRFGYLKSGLDATVTVFDPENVADRATYSEPLLRPVGIDLVFVGGELVLDHGTPTDARPGRLMLK